MYTPIKKFRSTKTYVHSVGLSCCFRQWRATSHCRFLHGYALEVRVEFEGRLDDRNWVVDFGSLKPFKNWLEETFDHKTLVAKDDPMLTTFKAMDSCNMIQLVEVESTGCEKFAEMIFDYLHNFLDNDRIAVKKVEVREHPGNSAIIYTD